MKKKSLGTGSAWSLIFTIGLALFNLGIFGLILLFGNAFNRKITENFEVQVYLQKEIQPTDKQEFISYIQSQPWLAKRNQKPAIRFTSREEAGRKFMEETGENFSQFLGDNPLRDAFSLGIEEAYINPDNLKKIKSTLIRKPIVFEVVYIESLASTIQRNIQLVSGIFLAIGMVLFITSLWLIRNTVRLSVYSQRFLIRTMELVGAESWLIQKPYVFSMLRNGLLAGILAIFLLLFALHWGNEFIPGLNAFTQPEKIGLLFLALPLIGAVTGMVSAWQSVRGFQGRKLDELHRY
jgi:cell division transport system permease protein